MPAGLMTNRACLKAFSHEAGGGPLAKEVPAIHTRRVPAVAALAESSTGAGGSFLKKFELRLSLNVR